MIIVPVEDRFDWREPPFMTIAVAFLCFAVFSSETAHTIETFALFPDEIRWYQLISYQFLHADWMHLLGNMVFLVLFGFALEKHLGSLTFITLYLLTGVASGGGFALLNLDNASSLVGASGAIAGLMGLYLGVYGWRQREYFAVLGPIVTSFKAPALALLPVWLGYELVNAYTSDDNVAYMAHAFGISSGLLLYIIGGWFGLFKARTEQSIAAQEDRSTPAVNPIPARALKLEQEFKLVEALALCQRQLQSDASNEKLWHYSFSLAFRINQQEISRLYCFMLQCQMQQALSLGAVAYMLWKNHRDLLLTALPTWPIVLQIQCCKNLLSNNDLAAANHLIQLLIQSEHWHGETIALTNDALLPLISQAARYSNEASLLLASLAAPPTSAPSARSVVLP